MTTKTNRNLLLSSIVLTMIVSISGMQYAEASCTHCGDENDLRIMADWQSVGWFGPDHHLSDSWTNVSVGKSGTNSVTVTADKSGYIFPSFMVKSNSVSSKTASYSVSYTFEESDGTSLGSGTKSYTETFASYLNGETDRFDALRNGVKNGDKLTVTLAVTSLS